MKYLISDNGQGVCHTYMKKAGIELLRIISMLMIVTLHVLGSGGVIDATDPLSMKYHIVVFWEILSYGAVNCFALISGWCMGDKPPDYKRLLRFGLKVYIITFVIWVLRWNANTTWGVVFTYSFPFMTHQWYVTSYIGVLILVPVLNTFVQNAKAELLRTFSWVSMIIFPIITLITQEDLFRLSQGYSVLWLSLLYLQGAIIKKLDPFKKISVRAGIAFYFLFTLLAYSSRVGAEYWHAIHTGEYAANNVLISYISPLIILQSLSLFHAALKINMQMPKLLYRISGGVFGVYVIHMHYMVVGPLINNRFAEYVKYNAIFMIFSIGITIIAIFTICLAISIFLTYLADWVWQIGGKIASNIRKYLKREFLRRGKWKEINHSNNEKPD